MAQHGSRKKAGKRKKGAGVSREARMAAFVETGKVTKKRGRKTADSGMGMGMMKGAHC